MKTQKLLRLPYGGGSTPITHEDALKYLGAKAIETGERRFNMRTTGEWGTVISVNGLATTVQWEEGLGYKTIVAYTLYGDRTMTDCQQSGYAIEGRVSLNGKRFRAFTTSTLFDLPDGKLINAACLHVCLDQPR